MNPELGIQRRSVSLQRYRTLSNTRRLHRTAPTNRAQSSTRHQDSLYAASPLLLPARQKPELCARVLLPSSHPPQPLFAGAGHEPASRLQSWAAASMPVTASRRHAVALSRPDLFDSYEADLPETVDQD